MNCANHPDRERTAFCQNCGKPLCNECIRTLGTSIFCEPCLTARTASAPPPGYGYTSAPGPGYTAPDYTASGGAGYPPAGPTGPPAPNPGLATLLGFIPGVGAMYNEQYAKGIVHLAVFATLVVLADDVNGVFGIFIAGWEFYMAIEAHHTARARRDGTPLPNPFGLNDLTLEQFGFGRNWPGNPGASTATGQPAPGAVPPSNPYAAPYAAPYTYAQPQWGAPQDAYGYGVPPVPVTPIAPYPEPNPSYYRRFPSGAVWLIGLGILFLVGNAGMFHIGRFFGPFLLIGIGVWCFVRRMMSTGHGLENDGTPLYHWRLSNAIRGAFWIVLTGIIWLLAELHILPWSRSWPLFLIGGGLMLIFKRTMHDGYGYAPPFPGVPAAPPATSTAVVPSDPSHGPGNTQEGR